MTDRLTEQQLTGIATRAAHLHEYAVLADEPLQADADRLTGQDVPALVADVRQLKARVRELERPAVEEYRNKIRFALSAMICQAEEDHDPEGASDVQCRLQRYEEQWVREDAATASL